MNAQPISWGRALVWSPLEGRLYCFDNKGKRLAWYEPATEDSGSFDLPMRASAAAPRSQGGLILATEKGLAALDATAGTVEMLRPFALPEGFRTNDGKIDLEGNFWWSTMDDNHGKRPGAVFRTSPDLHTERVLEGIHIPNTISMSADKKTLYMADSSLKTIFAHQIADLTKISRFAHTAGQPGTPDGSAVDAHGYLWNAQWGGSKIVRYSPNGLVDMVVPMPVSQPSSCAFGGEDMTTLVRGPAPGTSW